MFLSIIIPVFNELPENIQELYERIIEVCNAKEYEFEILFVDDGSSNEILSFLTQLHLMNKKVKILSFDKNYGQAIAVWAGFNYAKGDILIVMDADLQYLPEEIPYFVEKINNGYELVGGRRPKSFITPASKALTFSLNLATGTTVHDHGCTYNALKKELVDRVFKVGFTQAIKPMAVMLARNKTEIDVTFCKRRYGSSKYNFLRYFVSGLIYFFSFLTVKSRESIPYKIKMALEQ